jgi:hypothetical protein
MIIAFFAAAGAVSAVLLTRADRRPSGAAEHVNLGAARRRVMVRRPG